MVFQDKESLLNINLGHNQELMEHCQKLKEYAQFVSEVRKRLDRGVLLEEAADEAVSPVSYTHLICRKIW